MSTASADTIVLNHGFLKVSGLEDPQEVITPGVDSEVELKNVTIGGGGDFTVAANADENETWEITSDRTGGTFTITYDGQTTTALDFDASASEVRDALRALSNLGVFDVQVTGGPLPATIDIEFVGSTVYGRDLPDLTFVDSGTGGTALVVDKIDDGDETSDFDFPQFEGSASGVPLAVDVEPAGTVSGNFNTGTGVLTTTSQNFAATVALGPPVNATCVLTPIPLDFSTEKQEVFFGDRFDAAALPTNGAFLDGWSTLPGSAAPGCGLINSLTAGPGALWLSNGIATPTLVPPPDPPVVTPPKKKCKKGQKLVKGKCKKKKKKKKKK